VSDEARTRVLLVDDEEAITSTLAPFLERSGFDVRVEADGQSALDAHVAFAPHIVVSDVLMPRMDGRELVRSLRRADEWTPVIMLTKVDASFERTAALEEGADDYLGKPFDPPELVARIRAVLRRTAGGGKPLTASSQLVSAGLRLDRVARRVQRDGVTLELTPKALTLLEYLMSHPDEAHTREHLLETLWGFEFAVTTRAVDHRIAELRRALGDDAQQPRWIETLPGAGYRFCAPVSAS
jgi:DNA-binding response OmpR family regulator